MMIEIMYNYNLKMVDSPGGKFIIYANDAKNSLWKSLTKRFNELCYRMSYFQRFWGSFEYLHFFRIYEFRILIVENVLQIEDMLLHTISFISRKNVILHKYSSRTPFSLPHFLTALVNLVTTLLDHLSKFCCEVRKYGQDFEFGNYPTITDPSSESGSRTKYDFKKS